MRVFALSDVHVDYRPNQQWLSQLSQYEFTDDILILAGDISHHSDLVESSFKQLSRCFKRVHFVPGNHDLWVKKSENLNSLQKFDVLMSQAAEYDIATVPVVYDSVEIAPLLTWYDFSFGECTPYLQERWMDFILCKWPDAYRLLTPFTDREKAITRYFHDKNSPRLSTKPLISFSHFLPRIDLMPDYIPEIHQRLYPILGNDTLDLLLRDLGAACHVYGHSHVNRDVIIDKVRYVNNAFGSPGEERISAKQLMCIAEFNQ